MKLPKHRIDYDQSVEIIEEQRLHEPKMFWQKGDPPPPWKPPARKADVEKYRFDMIEFIMRHIPDPDLTPNPPEVSKRQVEWIMNDGPEIAAAEKGNLEPLRKKYPHLAKFLHRAKGERHKRGISSFWRKNNAAKHAALMVKNIDEIWMQHYGKKVRRFKPTSVEITASLWRVDVADVKSWIKQLDKDAKRKSPKTNI